MAEITREDVAALIQEEYSNVLLDTVAEQSAVIRAFGTVPLGTKVTNAPVLASLPEAKWVSETAPTEDDKTGVKPTSKATWANKQFVVEEIAVIIPVHEEDRMFTTDGKVVDDHVVVGAAAYRCAFLGEGNFLDDNSIDRHDHSGHDHFSLSKQLS